ncbi:Universal stress protein family protein [Cupriavidus sp. YR651]|uniref:universal stress protein n=1 Tax=Cupriavidus sp. YR651 TaxID=1855315 RepID=UPI0008891E3B|nr:universal stress protein [Cupriavidus sp. YR651]SDD82775.1 Universal stress protein family protein [Cupriavidus sp. YR651]
MAYHTIFAHLDASARAFHRLELGRQLAHTHGCRLVGLFASFSPETTWLYLTKEAARYLEEDRARRDALRDAVRQRFEHEMSDQSIEWEWRNVEGDPVTAVLREAREASLLIVGQFDANDPHGFIAPKFVESLVLESGRPVLVVPSAGEFPHVGQRALVAWDGGREAARALHDALPLLAGSAVELFCASTATQALRTDAAPVSHAARLLERQGATVSIHHSPAGADMIIGERMLSHAADFDADLIVMGAYGHGRFRELALGGVTRTLLASMTVPVLMSH